MIIQIEDKTDGSKVWVTEHSFKTEFTEGSVARRIARVMVDYQSSEQTRGDMGNVVHLGEKSGTGTVIGSLVQLGWQKDWLRDKASFAQTRRREAHECEMFNNKQERPEITKEDK